MIAVDLENDISIRGAVRVERTPFGLLPRRATEESFRRIPDAFMRASVGQSAGIRLAFRTAATRIDLRVSAMRMTETETATFPASFYDVTREGVVVATGVSTTGPRYVFSFDRPGAHIVDGPDDIVVIELPGGDAAYELWFPFSDEVEIRGMSADAPVTPATSESPRWIHHGSSISHGYVASRTTMTWSVIAAHKLGLDLVSLAYSGNALLDQLTARSIRDTPADRISLKLGINVVNGDHMRRRVFRSAVHGFLDTIRDGHPSTPLLLVSPVYCPPVERLPGPTVFERRDPDWVGTAGRADEVAEGKLSLEVVREELAAIAEDRRAEDPALTFLHGTELYGAADNARLPMPDNLHPGDDVNALIAERFTTLASWNTGTEQ